MDQFTVAAIWLPLAAAVLGLGALLLQGSVIRDQLDPFDNARSRAFLGLWALKQPSRQWTTIITKPMPIGPVISANLTEGFAGMHTVHLSRLPSGETGQAPWTVLLGVVHAAPKTMNTQPRSSGNEVKVSKATAFGSHSSLPAFEWEALQLQPLVKDGGTACISISRTTLITLLSVTNARQITRYSGAAGHRATYASYSGLWSIEWPLGGQARVKFSAHDSHTTASDVYPPTFSRRVEKCINMTAGVIVSRHGLRCAFPGRKVAGKWLLQHTPRGFPGAHGSRHLYNMMGGKVYEIDMLTMLESTNVDSQQYGPDSVILHLPSRNGDSLQTELHVPPEEAKILAACLDALPWSSLSWSVHRGLRDILTTFAEPMMRLYRGRLVTYIRSAVRDHPDSLVAQGWERSFVTGSMADMAAAALAAQRGNSGDLVRVVTDIVTACVCEGTASMTELDQTSWWQEHYLDHRRTEDSAADELHGRPLSKEAVIALVKLFVLQWSAEFDYQIYYDFPVQLLL